MRHRSTGRRLDGLALASVAFVVANVLHSVDHERTGTARLTTAVTAGGVVITLGALVVLWLALRRHSRAPLVAAAVGLGTAVGVAASHLAPHWSVFSDSYWDLSLDAFSWAIVLLEIATALVLALVARRDLEARRRVANAA
jgi:hypothetical protein